MNGAEFFMEHAGYKLLPPGSRSDDVIADAEAVLGMSLPLYVAGKTLRLSSCWMVITPDAVTTSFKAHHSSGFDTSGKLDFKAAVRAAAGTGKPFMVLQLGKRSTAARDLFVSYDTRAVRMCGQGETQTINMKEDKRWTS
jgi:hypothetical protein